MALTEKTFYGMTCDGCGKPLQSDEYGEEYQDNVRFLEEIAEDSGWLLIRDKHYCESCHHYDDEDVLCLGDGTRIEPDDPDWI